MAYQMKFVPRAELKNVEEGHVIIGMELAGVELNITERYVATVNGLVSLQNGNAGSNGCFYSYPVVEAQDRFAPYSWVDVGFATDWREPPPEQAQGNREERAAEKAAERDDIVSTPGPNVIKDKSDQ